MKKEILDHNALKLRDAIREYYKLKARYSKLSSRRNPLRMLVHSEDCDDEYQEQLEIGYELSDLRDNIIKLENTANAVVTWFMVNGYYRALKVWLNSYMRDGIKYLREHNFNVQ